MTVEVTKKDCETFKNLKRVLKDNRIFFPAHHDMFDEPKELINYIIKKDSKKSKKTIEITEKDSDILENLKNLLKELRCFFPHDLDEFDEYEILIDNILGTEYRILKGTLNRGK